ncbi:hypothetical protein DSC47_10190 [Elizabethkingia miricola]|uniref:YqaJ viral recombinase family protein n=1 Tax=Elizabethkingia bruuniana TaxID=1756149 RepID=UPI0009995AB7|nr:YqaJ viral recombinase family protein [Elizabethkingia bruuniana]OPC66342.1 hypothetical protein BAY13_16525 [Elizabethkingia bruuniana]RBI91660.1 hypothetical protein DSC47_10190 [Elizabethkingia miricola]
MIKYAVFEEKEAWDEFRGDYLTASEIYRILPEPKKKGEILSVGAKTYIKERLVRRLAPKEPEYYNQQMEHGNDTEPAAVLRIAKELGKSVEDDDFIYTSVNGYVFFYDEKLGIGGTPDVIIKNQMSCEVKCPLSKTHLDYLLLKTQEEVRTELPKYYGQMQLNMHLTKTDKCLFVSFDDRFYNEKHHYHQIEILKDDEYIENLLKKAKAAKAYKEQILKELNANT